MRGFVPDRRPRPTAYIAPTQRSRGCNALGWLLGVTLLGGLVALILLALLLGN